jgi:hypothetical protein
LVRQRRGLSTSTGRSSDTLTRLELGCIGFIWESLEISLVSLLLVPFGLTMFGFSGCTKLEPFEDIPTATLLTVMEEALLLTSMFLIPILLIVTPTLMVLTVMPTTTHLMVTVMVILTVILLMEMTTETFRLTIPIMTSGIPRVILTATSHLMTRQMDTT